MTAQQLAQFLHDAYCDCDCLIEQRIYAHTINGVGFLKMATAILDKEKESQ